MTALAIGSGLRRRPLLALALFLVAATLGGCGVNTIPTLDEQAKAAWSQVLNQYQRRADLVPNLVETVRAYAAHEKDTLTAVTEARAKVAQMQVPADRPPTPEPSKASRRPRPCHPRRQRRWL